MKRYLTRRYLDAVESRLPREFIFDDKVPHLAIQVTAGGCKTWYLYRRVKGKPKQYKLGRYPQMTPDQARTTAQKMNGLVAQGLDPSEKETPAETTFGVVFAKYIDLHAKPHKKTWKRDSHRYDVYLKSRLGNKVFAEIATEDLQAIHVTLGAKNGKGQANCIRTLLSSVFKFAKEMGYWSGDNPMRQVKRYPANERGRFLDPEEMPRFLEVLNRANSQTFRDYVLLSLYTGARQGNVLAMRWAAMDLKRRVWVIPAAEHKSGKTTTVILSDQAVEILKRRKREATGEFVLPGRVHGHYGRPTVAWKRQMARCGFPEHVTMHDLRRTFGSWQAAAGVSLHIIGKSLGHVSTSATAIYARINNDPVRQAVEAVTAAMQKAGKSTGKDGAE